MTQEDVRDKLYRIVELEAKFDSMMNRLEDIVEYFQKDVEDVRQQNVIIATKFNELLNCLREAS